MPRPLFVVPLTLALLAGPAPGNALAEPPEGPSGKMAFVDEVAAGLRAYGRETDELKRLRSLKALAVTRDPRVAIVLYEAYADPSEGFEMRSYASLILASRFLKGTRFSHAGDYYFRDWWKANEADLRRRAKYLPR